MEQLKASPVSQPRTRTITRLVLVAWLAAVTGGMVWLLRYSYAPGALDSPPRTWPAASQLVRDGDRPVLLLFAHPHCPCTRASLRELDRLSARTAGAFQALIVFIDFSREESEWLQSDLRKTAESIAGADLFVDAGGVETDRFCARTSGLTLYYASSGELQFAGGITPARGHEGISEGILALEALCRGETPHVSETNVFGCPLQTPLMADALEAD